MNPAATAPHGTEDGKPAVEGKQQDASDDESGDETQPVAVGVPLLFPFAPTPIPLPLLSGELALTPGTVVDEPGRALPAGEEPALRGGGVEQIEAPDGALVDADGVAVKAPEAEQPEALPDAAQADGAEPGLDALLTEFAPAPDDVTLPEGLLPRPVASTTPPSVTAFDGANPPPVTTETSLQAPQSDTCQVEEVAAQPREAKPPRETAVEKSSAPDEGVMEGLRGVSSPRHDPAPATSPQGESQPVSAADRRDLPAQVARISASIVRELGGDGAKEIRVRLDPPSLGEIRVHVESERGEVRIHVVAASPETAVLLSNGQSNLREELVRQGLALANFSAGTETTFNFTSEGGFTRRERNSGRGPGPVAGRADEPIPSSIPVRRVGSGRLDATA